jgi:selenide, water dikinase
LRPASDDRLLCGTAHAEDAAILRFPTGKALVQTVDFFTPIVNNPYWFGQIAAANALSDVYAMGGRPYCAMNIVCFPVKKLPKSMLAEILRGGLDKLTEAGAVLAGGHSVEDQEIKYGLSVSGVVDPQCFATNGGLRPGDVLLLTKPLGTGVLATALKADLPGAGQAEQLLYQWAGRLNRAGGEVIETLGLKGATDVTGFGLGGHLLEMASASKVRIDLDVDRVPILDQALELAGMGMLPAGSFANKQYCRHAVDIDGKCDGLRVDLIFDAQTSGGLVLGVPETKVETARQMLLDQGDMACVIGTVSAASGGRPRLVLAP